MSFDPLLESINGASAGFISIAVGIRQRVFSRR
jgi:hypothetical protein